MTLNGLGRRICIMGPSNSGKSTLASVIGHARDLTPIHLDRLYHRPNTDWRPRAKAEFVRLHDDALPGESWVMDGNYSCCLPQRLARATGFILLDTSSLQSLVRYVRRCRVGHGRLGGLEGGRDSVKWAMIRHILTTTRTNRKRYDAMFERIAVPKIRLATSRDLARFYREEGLSRSDLQAGR